MIFENHYTILGSSVLQYTKSSSARMVWYTPDRLAKRAEGCFAYF